MTTLDRLPLVSALFLGVTLVTLPGSLHSQDAGEVDLPMGSDALRQRIGKTAAWKIIYRPVKAGGGDVAVAEEAVATGAGDGSAVERVQIERAGSVTYVRRVHVDKSVDEFWTVDERKIADFDGAAGLIFLSPNDIPTENYSETDFPELGWLLKTKASKIVDYQGQDCYLFEASEEDIAAFFQRIRSDEGDAARSTETPPAKAAKAFVSVESGLPVIAVSGDRAGVYGYDEPPTKLAIPDDFRQGFDDWSGLIRRAMPARSAP